MVRSLVGPLDSSVFLNSKTAVRGLVQSHADQLPHPHVAEGLAEAH